MPAPRDASDATSLNDYISMDGTSTSPASPRRTRLAVASLLLTLIGLISYYFLLPHPWSRATGIPSFAMLAIAGALGLAAARCDRRRRIVAVAVVNVTLAVLFVLGFFVLSAVPADQGFAELAVAPDFALPDHLGKPVQLREALTGGPVLLVFYRGFW